MGLQAKDAKVYMVIRVLDTHKHEWSIISPAGNAPPQRGGHSVGPLLGLHLQPTCHISATACLVMSVPHAGHEQAKEHRFASSQSVRQS